MQIYVLAAVHPKDGPLYKNRKYKLIEFNMILNYNNGIGLRTWKWTIGVFTGGTQWCTFTLWQNVTGATFATTETEF